MPRIFDILFSILLLLVLSPLFLIVTLILFLFQAEIFFLQERTGKNEQPFRILKFATMKRVNRNGIVSDQPTPIGKWLRKLSLNELPQLWNILKGDMAFVGPRPLLHSYLSLYSSEQKKRFKVLPGLTGYTQVKERPGMPWVEKFRMDEWYAENKSFFLDLIIIFKTPAVVYRRLKANENQKPVPVFNGKN